MAEELDEFGIPIKRKQVVAQETDEFGIPIKKKALSAPLRTPSQTSSIPSGANAFGGVPVNEFIGKEREQQVYNQLNQEEEARTTMSNRLNKIQSAYQGDKKQIQKAQSQPLNNNGKIVQGYDDDERTGNRAGFLYNELLSGVGDIASGLGDVGSIVAGGINASPNIDVVGALDMLKSYRDNVAPEVRSFLKDKIGTEVDKVLENKYRDETFTGAVGGLARTLPAIAATAVSGGAGTGALFLQSYDSALQSLDQSEAGRNLDDATKTIYATGIGVVSSALEKFGLDKIMKGETGLVSKLLTDRALKNAVKETGGKVTGDVFTKFLNKEVADLNGKFVQGGARVLDSYLTEYATGAAQEASTIAGENLLNSATGKPVFDTSKTDTWSGFLKRVNQAGNAEGIGGGLLGTAGLLGGFKRSEIKAKEQQLRDIEASLANENVSDVAKEVLVQNKIKLQSEMQQVADKTDEAFDKLDAKQKEQATGIVENSAKIEEALLDPNVTPEVKVALEEQLKTLDKELSEIKPVEEVKPKTDKEYFNVYEDAVNKAKTVDEAYSEVTKDGAVLSDTFNKKYNPDGSLSQEETFAKFYDEVKPNDVKDLEDKIAKLEKSEVPLSFDEMSELSDSKTQLTKIKPSIDVKAETEVDNPVKDTKPVNDAIDKNSGQINTRDFTDKKYPLSEFRKTSKEYKLYGTEEELLDAYESSKNRISKHEEVVKALSDGSKENYMSVEEAIEKYPKLGTVPKDILDIVKKLGSNVYVYKNTSNENNAIKDFGDFYTKDIKDNSFVAYYPASGSDVLINESMLGSQHSSVNLLAHELAHVYTASIVNTSDELLKDYQKQFKSDVIKYYKFYKNIFGDGKARSVTYGFFSPAEFISEYMTNKSFRELINKRDNSFYIKVKKFFSKLFNKEFSVKELDDVFNSFNKETRKRLGISDEVHKDKVEAIEEQKTNTKVDDEAKPTVPKTKDVEKVEVPVKEGKDDTFYTGRGKKYEDLKTTKGDFIFFSKNPKISEWYGGDSDNISEAKLDTSKFLDLTTQENKAKFVREKFTDKDIQELYPDLSRRAIDDRDVRKTWQEKLETLTEEYRKRLEENRFSGSNKEQKFLLEKIKKEGFGGVKLLDTHFGESDISYVVVDKSLINQDKEPSVKEEAKQIDEPTQFAIDEINKGAINWDGDRFTPRPELGFEWKDIRKGKQDLLNGKDTSASKRLVEAINKAKADGGYNFVQGSGKLTNKIFVPIDGDVKQATDLTTDELKYVAENEQTLASEYDSWFDNLSEQEKQEELNSIENGNENNGKTDTSAKSKEDVSDKQDNEAEREASEPTVKQESDRLVKAKEKLQSAKDEFADFVKKSMGTANTGADLATFVAKATKLMSAYAEVGIVKLADVIKEMRSEYGDKFVDDNIDGITQAHENSTKETTGINQENIDTTRKNLGMEEINRARKADTERNAQAEKWIEDGNSIPDLLKRLEKGALPTDVENVVLRQYISSLEARNNKTPTAELLADINRATKVITEARSELGRALRSGIGDVEVVDNLSNFLLDEMDAMGVTTIPQSMINELAEKYAKGQTAKEAYEEGYQKAVDEFIKQQAQNELDKAKPKAKNRPNVKKSDTDYSTERKAIVDSIREKLKKARSQANAVPVPYLAELISISPDVAKLVKSYVEQGVNKLDDLVRKIKSDLEEDIDGITDNDVRDLIAGEYRAKKATKNEILADVRELQAQAKLLKQIEDLENGKVPSSTTGKIRRAQEIDELKKRVKELEDETGVTDLKGNNAKREYLAKKISSLKKDLELGNFEKKNELPRKMKLDKETQKLQDEYIKFTKETARRRDLATYQRMSKRKRAWQYFIQYLGLRRLIQTALDWSMGFRQAAPMTLNLRNIRVTAKAYQAQLQTTFSEKKYDRLMFAIENNPMYKNMLEDKIVFSDIDSKDNLKRDEDFRSSFIYQIPILREPLLASGRAAAGFLNTARYELYKKGAERLEDKGIKREVYPQHYESMANWVMNVTGRGKFIKALENSSEAQQLLGDTFYGARLMASRFNLLNPNTYIKMPKEVRVQALYDVLSYTTTVAIGLTALATLSGATVSLDPEDPDFLKAKWGNKRYDFFTGGLSTYIRTILMLVKAAGKRAIAEVSGDKSDIKKANKYAMNAVGSVPRFFHYKLAPNTSYVIASIRGKDAIGQPFDPTELFAFYPMYTEDIIDAIKKDEGIASSITVFLPNFLGIGMQDYDNKKKTSSGSSERPNSGRK